MPAFQEQYCTVVIWWNLVWKWRECVIMEIITSTIQQSCSVTVRGIRLCFDGAKGLYSCPDTHIHTHHTQTHSLFTLTGNGDRFASRKSLQLQTSSSLIDSILHMNACMNRNTSLRMHQHTKQSGGPSRCNDWPQSHKRPFWVSVYTHISTDVCMHTDMCTYICMYAHRHLYIHMCTPGDCWKRFLVMGSLALLYFFTVQWPVIRISCTLNKVPIFGTWVISPSP